MSDVSRRFRKELARQLPAWRAEGVVSPEQAKALEDRYALAALAHEGHGMLLAVIYTIGAILIGGGVISFVAAHWEAIPKAAKVAMLFAAMLAAHGGGWWLWRVKAGRPRLGHALVVLGTLIYGANIGLLAQIFHISSEPYNGFFWWAVGAAVLGYATWSTPNLFIALATSLVWFFWRLDTHAHSFNWYPLVLLALGLVPAYVNRSGFLFFIVSAAVALTTLVGVAAACDTGNMMVLAAAALGVFFTGLGLYHVTVRPRREIGPTALALGALALAVTVYIISFREVANELEHQLWWWRQPRDLTAPFVFLALLLAAGVALSTLAGRGIAAARALRPCAAAAWFAAVVLVAVSATGARGLLGHVFANVALLGLGVGLVWSGFAAARRTVFWLGAALLALLILSRFLEYETGLMLKSAAFLATGAGVIYGGIKFENALRRQETAHE